MICGTYSYSRTKHKNIGLLNSYYVSKQSTWTTPVKEYSTLEQASSDTKISKTNKKVEYEFFHYGDLNHWAFECMKLSENERDKILATKEKYGRAHTQVSEAIEYHKDSEDTVSKQHFTQSYYPQRVLRYETNILISIHGPTRGYSHILKKVKNIFEGGYLKCVYTAHAW